MRLLLPSLLTLILSLTAANAQSIMDNLPQQVPQNAPDPAPEAPNPAAKVAVAAAPASAPAAVSTASTDPYTVTDVNADVTADTAAHARDQALVQAEHSAFAQLCARVSAPDSVAKLSDDAVAALVQSFDVQSERISAVRYIGVFTIHFKPISTQKKLGKYMTGAGDTGVASADDAKATAASAASHLTIAVQTPSLQSLAQTKRHLTAIAQVVRVDTLDLGRGVSHVDLLYNGALDELENSMSEQGLYLHQAINGEWELVDSEAR